MGVRHFHATPPKYEIHVCWGTKGQHNNGLIYAHRLSFLKLSTYWVTSGQCCQFQRYILLFFGELWDNQHRGYLYAVAVVRQSYMVQAGVD